MLRTISLIIISLFICLSCSKQTTQKTHHIVGVPERPDYEKLIPYINEYIDIKIEIDQTDIILGELPDVFIYFINRGDEEIKIPMDLIPQTIHHLDRDNKFNLYRDISSGHMIQYFTILAYGELAFPTFILQSGYYIGNMGLTYPKHHWYEGNYTFQLGGGKRGIKIKSNKIEFRILPVPEHLINEFNDLRPTYGDWSEIKKIKDPDLMREKFKTGIDYEKIFQKNKGGFYEKEFYIQLFKYPKYRDVFRNPRGESDYIQNLRKNDPNYESDAIELISDYILKYPNNYVAFRYFGGIYYYSNRDNKRYIIQNLFNKLIEKHKNQEGENHLLRWIKNNRDTKFPELIINNSNTDKNPSP